MSICYLIFLYRNKNLIFDEHNISSYTTKSLGWFPSFGSLQVYPVFSTCDFKANKLFWKRTDFDKPYYTTHCDEELTSAKVFQYFLLYSRGKLINTFVEQFLVSLVLDNDENLIDEFLDNDDVITKNVEGHIAKICSRTYLEYNNLSKFFGFKIPEELEREIPTLCIMLGTTVIIVDIYNGCNKTEPVEKYEDYSLIKKFVIDDHGSCYVNVVTTHPKFKGVRLHRYEPKIIGDDEGIEILRNLFSLDAVGLRLLAANSMDFFHDMNCWINNKIQKKIT